MIQVGNDGTLKRADVKVGWLRGNYIYDHTDTKIGYISGQNIYTTAGKRLAYIYGEYMILMPSDTRIRIEENNKEVMGAISDVARAAIRLLLG
ncbi:MAG: 4-fold beta flower protein [bacterium]